MKEDLEGLLVIVLVTLFWAVLLITGENKRTPTTDQPTCECDSLKVINALLIEELNKWEDHAFRIKRIAGVPDTVSWSYKQKVIHSVNTYNLTH